MAVYAADFTGFNLAAVTAYANSAGDAAGAGTVYLRDIDEAHGTLIIE